MKIHILGICGTFMSGIALLAKQQGHEVTGSDLNVYPPMSDQLREQDITLFEGYDPAHIPNNIDCVLIGNVIKRGNPVIEYILNKKIPFTSGPEWLSQNILKRRQVIAIAGTHGKTTTTSLISWILEVGGQKPGFLIGGVPENFGISARLTDSANFVIEADEYDCAFFDKRSKFIHYHPNILIFNNLEFDHADIFPDLKSIQQQFHYLLRTVASNGLIIRPQQDKNIDDVLEMGCWTPVVNFGDEGMWRADLQAKDGSRFAVYYKNEFMLDVEWDLIGNHNVHNALAAIATAYRMNISMADCAKALKSFKNIKRRMELKAKVKEISVYDDFAHHPTAIKTTLAGLRAKIGNQRIIAVVEFGSYTMRTGVHKDALKEAFSDADMVVCKSTTMDWGLENLLAKIQKPTAILNGVENIIQYLIPQLKSGDHVIIMSNSGFEGIHPKIITAINQI